MLDVPSMEGLGRCPLQATALLLAKTLDTLPSDLR